MNEKQRTVPARMMPSTELVGDIHDKLLQAIEKGPEGWDNYTLLGAITEARVILNMLLDAIREEER